MQTRFALAVAAALTCGCAMSRDVGNEPKQSVTKAALALTQQDTGTYQLSISKEALNSGTEFLFSTSAVVTQYGEPSFNGLLSRVVFFKRVDGKVQLLESQKGATVDAALIKPNIVASFPIASEDDQKVGLEFNEALSNLLLSFDWYSSDGSSASFAFSDRFYGAKLVQRYVDEGKTDEQGRITVRQVAQADLQGQVLALELRYFLRPYAPDPSFPALVSKQDFRWSGYFESSPTAIAGTAGFQTNVSRFHPNKPLRYAISSSAPEEVRGAIRDGILYWNRVLGRDWLEVVDAPQGVTAPDLNYNLIQWVPEKGAGGAYADAQLDPLTGEVTNAQVYFPSAFYDNVYSSVTEAYARRASDIDSARTVAAQRTAAAGSHVQGEQGAVHMRSPKLHTGAQFQGGCELVNSRILTSAAKALSRRDLSDEQIKRVAADLVRHAIAHEVGHTLGLRHNFAGSLGSNIEPDEVDGLTQAYIETGAWPEDKVPGSSVMEYPAFEDDAAIGARIRLGYAGLAHDVAAIGVLYNDKPLPENGPLFCTDSEQGQTVGCAAYDTGADIVASLRKDIQDGANNVGLEYISWLRVAKEADVLDVFAATAADLDAEEAYSKRYQVAQLLSSTSALLTADRKIGSPVINQKEIHKESLREVGETVLAAGGYDAFFGLLPKDFDARFQAQVDELLDTPWITSGVTSYGKPWSFSADELAAIREYAPAYLKEYKEAAASADISALSLQDPVFASLLESLGPNVIIIGGPAAAGGWEPPVLAEELQQLIVDRAQYYATATSGSFKAKVAVAADPSPAPDSGAEPSSPAKKKSGDQPKEPSEPSGDGEGDDHSGGQEVVIKNLKLPIFSYSTKVRSSVSSLLSSEHSEDRLWLRELHDQPGEALSAQLDKAAQGTFSGLQLDGSDPEAQRWILDNQDVLGALGGGGSSEPEPEPEPASP